MRTLAPALIASLLLLGACATTPSPPRNTPDARPVREHRMALAGTADKALANLGSASASLVSGRVLLVQEAGGVRVSGEVGGLVRNGAHGLQVHERGDCSAVDAASAGNYYDPAVGVLRGDAAASSQGRIAAGPDGVARVDLLIEGAVLGGGADNDIAGRSLLVLGATPGAISARVACGIITISN